MFRSGDIVLYRLDVSQIKQIKQEKDRTFYLLYSLGSEYCEFKVPCDNAGGHLQSLPSNPAETHVLQSKNDSALPGLFPAIPKIKGTFSE